MPKCPKCGEEIEYLLEFQKELTTYRAIVDPNNPNEFDYDIDNCEPKPLAAPYWACPECFETLFKFRNKAKAIAFLKGT